MKKKDIIENILFSIVNNEKYVNLYENIYLITDTSTIFFGYITAIETEHNGVDSGPQRGGVDQLFPPTEAAAEDTTNAAKLKNS